ncbi:MAG: adenylosuccinate synthetase [Candidatus Hodarchaeaceae archaeon]|nr:adenylosuccinate synthetase [Candidatus Hodarchaeaceae archaeon]
MSCTIIAGGTWGDEGKGKIVAYLALNDKPKIIARAGVGPNAGHTVYYQGKKFGLRQIPSGFVYEDARLLIGPGVLINPEVVLEEVKLTGVGDRLGIDRRCTVIEPSHIEQDRSSEHLKGKIGTTGTGCGPANVARVNRTAKLAEGVPELERFLADVPKEINDSLRRGESVLIEGSQGFGLSLIHGTYPYVTSKDTAASTLAADVGVGPTKVDDVMLVFKAYVSRVGAGPFPTEIPQEKAEELGIVEFGTVTGRRRRIGTFDFDLAKRSVMINGATQLTITCLDRLFKGASGIRSWDQLPSEAKEFVEKIEKELEVPVTIISTGAALDSIIDMRAQKL